MNVLRCVISNQIVHAVEHELSVPSMASLINMKFVLGSWRRQFLLKVTGNRLVFLRHTLVTAIGAYDLLKSGAAFLHQQVQTQATRQLSGISSQGLFHNPRLRRHRDTRNVYYPQYFACALRSLFLSHFPVHFNASIMLRAGS